MPDVTDSGVTGTGTDGIGFPTEEPTATTMRTRRGPDPVALGVGLLSLAMAVAAFVGWTPDLSGFDPRWLLAVGAAVVGVLLLVGSLRGRREHTARVDR